MNEILLLVSKVSTLLSISSYKENTMRFLYGLMLGLCSSLQAADVLLIESYHSGYEWDKSYLLGLHEELDPSIEMVRFEMNTKRRPESQFDSIANDAWAFYLERKPQVVILGDDNAFRLMYPKLYDQPIAIVFLGINSNPRRLLMQYSGQAQVTGVLERPLLLKNLSEISKMINKRQVKVRVLFDSGTTSKIASEFIIEQYNLLKDSIGVEVEVHNIALFKEWQAKVSSAKLEGFDAILVGLYQTLVDEHQENVPAHLVIDWTNQHSLVPLFTFMDYAVGKGKALGGVVTFGQSQGRATAQIINRILNGEGADLIPIQIDTQGKALFSRSEAERWNIMPPKDWQAVD